MKMCAFAMCGLLIGGLPCAAQTEENVAGARLYRGDLDGAIAALDTAIMRTPRAALYASRADAYLRKGLLGQANAAAALDQAVDDATEALRLDASTLTATMTRALARQAKGEHALAIVDFTAVLSARPASADALAGRCLSYQLSGNQGAAQTDRQAVEKLSARKAAALATKLGGN